MHVLFPSAWLMKKDQRPSCTQLDIGAHGAGGISSLGVVKMCWRADAGHGRTASSPMLTKPGSAHLDQGSMQGSAYGQQQSCRLKKDPRICYTVHCSR